jgi:hypothetical protein
MTIENSRYRLGRRDVGSRLGTIELLRGITSIEAGAAAGFAAVTTYYYVRAARRRSPLLRTAPCWGDEAFATRLRTRVEEVCTAWRGSELAPVDEHDERRYRLIIR